MSRKILTAINSDSKMIELRMQAEDLVNAADRMSYGEYAKESERIERQINERIAQIYVEYGKSK